MSRASTTPLAGPAARLSLPAAMISWSRLRFTLLFSGSLGFLIGLGWESGWFSGFIRVVMIGLAAMLAFGFFEQWPKHLPQWLARWTLQVIGVAAVILPTTILIYWFSTKAGAPPFWMDKTRMGGFAMLSVLGLLLAPWAALAALVRQKDALARNQALEFALERSELERQALDARMHLLQAQVAPHFLFNTLANVQALVDTGSPQASAVLGSLITYLRAAVPRLHEASTTLGQELTLAQAYLELMHMRMPDRLQFSLTADDEARAQHCPPMTLLTLVENAVKHGIDPGEDGGSIDVSACVREGRCLIRVNDTGVGFGSSASRGLGSGLSTLRERLRLVFAGDAHLRIEELQPHGVSAEIDIPVTVPLAGATS